MIGGGRPLILVHLLGGSPCITTQRNTSFESVGCRIVTLPGAHCLGCLCALSRDAVFCASTRVIPPLSVRCVIRYTGLLRLPFGPMVNFRAPQRSESSRTVSHA